LNCNFFLMGYSFACHQTAGDLQSAQSVGSCIEKKQERFHPVRMKTFFWFFVQIYNKKVVMRK